MNIVGGEDPSESRAAAAGFERSKNFGALADLLVAQCGGTIAKLRT